MKPGARDNGGCREKVNAQSAYFPILNTARVWEAGMVVHPVRPRHGTVVKQQMHLQQSSPAVKRFAFAASTFSARAFVRSDRKCWGGACICNIDIVRMTNWGGGGAGARGQCDAAVTARAELRRLAISTVHLSPLDA